MTALLDGLPASAMLRERTADHHRQAERSPFQQQFVRGQLPRDSYVTWLEQMLCVYRPLEAFLGSHPAAREGGLDAARWRRTPQLEQDLALLAPAAAAPTPLPATAAFLARLSTWAATQPAAILGVLYVLEGSTNGGQYIARGLRRAYGLEDGRGLAFLDPHGERQRDTWQSFRAELDAVVTAEEAQAVLEGAVATFQAVSDIGSDILAA